ncbi:hypothetical protein J6590_055746 [Homalodisca vitripennis]|nr:hypothetical protein J6590_055746 [Homalodisca vitripennis]
MELNVFWWHYPQFDERRIRTNCLGDRKSKDQCGFRNLPHAEKNFLHGRVVTAISSRLILEKHIHAASSVVVDKKLIVLWSVTNRSRLSNRARYLLSLLDRTYPDLLSDGQNESISGDLSPLLTIAHDLSSTLFTTGANLGGDLSTRSRDHTLVTHFLCHQRLSVRTSSHAFITPAPGLFSTQRPAAGHMASKLRAQEVAALQRALESERFATKSAQERAKELQQALDSERSAVRALKREAASQARAIREEEAKKYNALIEQLKTKMELAQNELVAMEKESTTRALTAQFHRELQTRQEEWRRDSRRQLEPLQEQLKEAQRACMESPPQRETEALVHSLHADFHRSLHQKQEEWRRESKAQVDALTNQLRELQRLYTDTCNKLTTTTNEAETIPKLRQEIHTLKLQNKELEEKVQILMEADRRKVEEFRSQHEENAAKIAELQRAARKEAFQLVS